MWATIYKNGQLRFSSTAAKKMDLKAGKVCLVSEIKDNCFAIVITALCDCRNFRIQKNRKYFYVNIRSFLYSRGIDYAKRRITYDISETGEALCSYPIFVLSTRTGQGVGETVPVNHLICDACGWQGTYDGLADDELCPKCFADKIYSTDLNEEH